MNKHKKKRKIKEKRRKKKALSLQKKKKFNIMKILIHRKLQITNKLFNMKNNTIYPEEN